MDPHNSYRTQQCSIDNITDIRVVMEQGILQRNIFKNAACIGGEKKNYVEKNYLVVTTYFENQHIWLKQTLKDDVLMENEVYQMMIEKKHTRMSKNSGETVSQSMSSQQNNMRNYFEVYIFT